MALVDLDYILDYKARVYLVSTGAGAGFQGHLWNVPGISSLLVGAAFPYAPDDTDDFLGFSPENYCCKETAIDLAMKAFYKAYKLGESPTIGIGLTASVASTRIHRGNHRVFGAYISEKSCNIYEIILEKGSGKQQRIVDGIICDKFLELILRKALNINEPTDLFDRFTPYNTIENANELALNRFFKYPFFGKDGSRKQYLPRNDSTNLALFPGSFNPPHEGHFGIADLYEKIQGPVIFNIQTKPPHKESISIQSMLKRAKCLKGREILFSNDLSLYIDKSNRFPGTGMIVGVDTLIRLLDPKWGPNVDELINTFSKNKTTFYVVDRIIDGKLVSVWDLNIPDRMCYVRLVGEWDVSSTELRKLNNL